MPFDGVGAPQLEALGKIDAVIDLLATPDKWCKGALRSHDGRYCIRGAVRSVDAAELLEPTIFEAIGQIAGKRFRRIEAFNDHPNTSYQQIVAVLQRTRKNMAAGHFAIGTKFSDGTVVEPPPPPQLVKWYQAVQAWFA